MEEKITEKGNEESKKENFKIKEIVSCIRKRARDLCQIEAREAFATYLLRVQQRFMVEANSTTHTRGRSHEKNDQIELVCRFLTRASGNLENPLGMFYFLSFFSIFFQLFFFFKYFCSKNTLK